MLRVVLHSSRAAPGLRGRGPAAAVALPARPFGPAGAGCWPCSCRRPPAAASAPPLLHSPESLRRPGPTAWPSQPAVVRRVGTANAQRTFWTSDRSVSPTPGEQVGWLTHAGADS